jgi:Exopolyphosphatase-related proteins
VAAVLKEVAPRRFVTSLRSNGNLDVAAAAARLGGGHHRAAGFTHDGMVQDVLAALRRALDPPEDEQPLAG